MLELWGMWNIPLLSSLPGPLWSRVVAPDIVQSMDQIELNSVLLQSWIVWNGTVFDIKTVLMLNWTVWNSTVLYPKLNCFRLNCFWHLKCVIMLNWIVWNRSVYMYKMDLPLITYNGWYDIKRNQIISFNSVQKISSDSFKKYCNYKLITYVWRHSLSNGCRRSKWKCWPKFKSWTMLSTFRIAQIHSGMLWICLFSIQLWVYSRLD